MLTNIDVMEILNDSKLLKLANLECINLGGKLILKSENMNENPIVYKLDIDKEKDKFAINSVSDKIEFSYEYVSDNNQTINALNIKDFNEKIELLKVDNKILINIYNNDKSNIVLGIDEDTFSIEMNSNKFSFNLNYDPTKNNCIQYNERYSNVLFNLSMHLRRDDILLNTWNGVANTNITKNETNRTLFYAPFNDYALDVIHTDHVQMLINYALEIIGDKLPNVYEVIRQYKICNCLYPVNKPKTVKRISNMINKNFSVSDIIEKQKVISIEKDQKILRIRM